MDRQDRINRAPGDWSREVGRLREDKLQLQRTIADIEANRQELARELLQSLREDVVDERATLAGNDEISRAQRASFDLVTRHIDRLLAECEGAEQGVHTRLALEEDELGNPRWVQAEEQPPISTGADPYRVRLQKLEDFADKVDAIRNSIVGRQSMNWSMHAYPLVEALKDIGKGGLGYEEAKAFADEQIAKFRNEVLAKQPPAPADANDAPLLTALDCEVDMSFEELQNAVRELSRRATQ